MAERRVTFGGLLRELRAVAGLTQEELAGAAGVSVRSVRELERGRVATPQKETVRLLAGALGLTGPARTEFEAVARSRPAAGGAAVPALRRPQRQLPASLVRQPPRSPPRP